MSDAHNMGREAPEDKVVAEKKVRLRRAWKEASELIRHGYPLSDALREAGFAHELLTQGADNRPPLAQYALTPSQWRERTDIKPIDYRLGKLLSTTTRALLCAPTGIGKTMLGLAWAGAMALGRDFCHWEGSGKPTRVLYIDGELPREDISSRIGMVADWFGEEPEDLRVLSTDDLEEELLLDLPEAGSGSCASWTRWSPSSSSSTTSSASPLGT
jgi:AAA domain